MKTDFILTDHGTIALLLPVTHAAKSWVNEHLPDDATTFCRSIVIEHRYVGDIVDGITNDNLTINH